jgi:drug/metabolite transporter (DMT)-like permease
MARGRGSASSRRALHRILMLRNGRDGGHLGYVTALSLVPLSTASAILQATPLASRWGGAVSGRTVGWRRWSAPLRWALPGVLIVIRPGMEGSDPDSLGRCWSVAGWRCAIWPRGHAAGLHHAQVVLGLGLCAVAAAGAGMMAAGRRGDARPARSRRAGGALVFGIGGLLGDVAGDADGRGLGHHRPSATARLSFALIDRHPGLRRTARCLDADRVRR